MCEIPEDSLQPSLVNGCSHLPLNAGDCFVVMEQEIWRPIVSSQYKYDVSSFGRIRNASTRKELKQSKTKKYYYVSMWYGRTHVRKSVSRLVAESFIPNPRNLPQVNHKDENPENNHVENLEWCTASYNSSYATRNERILKTRKLKNLKTREKPVLQIDMSGVVIRRYNSIMDAHRKTGIDFSNISKCCRDNCYNKTVGGYMWLFLDEVVPSHADIGDLIERKLCVSGQ